MTAQSDPYVRVYYGIVDDPKFETIVDDKAALGWWLALLIGADAMYPSPATLPHGISTAKLQKLIDARLVDILPGARYRVHGLSAEREKRHEQAVSAGRKRADGASRDGGRFTASDQQGTSKAPAGGGGAGPAVTSTPILSYPSRTEPIQSAPSRTSPTPAGVARNGSKNESDEERYRRYLALMVDESATADMRHSAKTAVEVYEAQHRVN